MRRLVPASGRLEPSTKKYAPWQSILTCWICGDYQLSPEFSGDDISHSTPTPACDWRLLWPRLLTFVSSGLAIRSVCDENEFVYLRADDNQTVHDLRAHLQQSQSYDASEILSVFPLGSDIWELLVPHSYVSSLKERAKSDGYTVEEGCHPAEPPRFHLQHCDPSKRHLLAIEQLVARAVVINLLPGTQHAKAASVYLQLVILYQCSRVFSQLQSALLELGGLGTLSELFCIVADVVYHI